MEENAYNPEPVLPNLNLDPAGIEHLKETRGWTFFISIAGFVFLGLLLLMGIAGGSAMSRMYNTPAQFGSGFFMVIMLIMIVIYFFPIYFLFNFSRYSKIAINNNDNAAFSESMRYLKLHYRYMGILMIILLSIYFLAFIFGLMAGSLTNLF